MITVRLFHLYFLLGIQVLDNYWETDPKWKNRSKKAKENRLSVAGGSLHCGGSVTQASTIDRMNRFKERLAELRAQHTEAQAQGIDLTSN
ncbi:hypothetical protein PIB30_099641 [Stylosanthes scabra]|uniref:Uncharacterized protein n=1 Tax=Stylosanthes scabra TaxID=79078 RepID=A0ABU6VVC5_9FABA|nr:hypothetical protein [Stylosanthes scabra]